MNWDKIAEDKIIEQTVKALEINGFNVQVVENGEQAKKAVLKLLPENAEVMSMTSTTNDKIGLSSAINESGKYDSVRNKLMTLDRATQSLEMQKLGSAPEYVVGSVHALTEDGHVMIASYSGSQLPAYAYGASNIIWVVGAQKIAKNIDDGFKRIEQHVLPLESQRVKEAYGMPSSMIAKMLILYKETVPNRINIILVKEKLGF